MSVARALAVCALAASPANAQTSATAAKLFQKGDYRSAAAAFEQNWRESGDVYAGVNAAIAWRTAGAYAHAYVLLSALLSREALPPVVTERAAEVRERLLSLTGTLYLSSELSSDTTARVDNEAPDWDGRAIRVNAGRHQLELSRPGCDPFRWSGVVLPTQKLPIPVAFTCTTPPGSIHLSLSGAAAVKVLVDGRAELVPGYDYDLPLSPGRHRISVWRSGLELHTSDVAVESARSTPVHVRVPWRAKSAGLIVGVAGQSVAAADGSTHGSGVVLGYEVAYGDSIEDWVDGRFTMGLVVSLGIATTTLGDDAPARTWAAVTGAFLHILPPIWHANRTSGLWVLDWEPGLFTFQFATRTREDPFLGLDEQATANYYGILPFVLTAEFELIHTELTLWPVGAVRHRTYSFVGDSPSELFSDLRPAVGISFTTGWKVLGD